MKYNFITIILATGFFVVYPAPILAAGANIDNNYFPTIQEAINHASSGDVITVEAGIYDEQVVIDGKSLTLQGAGDATVVRPSGAEKLTSLYEYPSLLSDIKISSIIIIRNTGASGVTIKDLKVDGINITILPAGAERLAGILYGDSGGVIQNVTVSTIKTNSIADRTYGINAVAVGNPVSVEIIGNRIIDFLFHGILAVGESLTVNIHGNAITGSANSPEIINGITLGYSAGGKVSGNIISGFHSFNDGWRSSGIILSRVGFKPVVVEGNEVFDADYGISVSKSTNNSVISQNYLHGNKAGVMIEDGAADNKVASNNITGNGQGIQIHGRQSSNETGNKPPGSGNVASNNTIAGNTIGIISFDDTQAFDAKNNWWGSAEPDFTKLIVGSVNYVPWLVTAVPVSSQPVIPEAEKPIQTEERVIPSQEKEIKPEKIKQPTEEIPQVHEVEEKPSYSSSSVEIRPEEGGGSTFSFV